MPEFLSASEYLKSATAPATRPNTPCRRGPARLRPLASSVWQLAHLRQSCSPCAMSAADTETGRSARAAAATSRRVMLRLMLRMVRVVDRFEGYHRAVDQQL